MNAGVTSRHDGVLAILLSLSAIVNVAMIVKNQSLHDVIARREAEGRLQPGTTISEIALNDRAQNLVTLRGDSPGLRGTFIYYFSPTCKYCIENYAVMQSLTTSLKGQYRRIGVLSRAEDWKTLRPEYETMFDYLGPIDAKDKQMLKLGGTPNTIVLDPTGKVLGATIGWYGKSNAKWLSGVLGFATPQVNGAE